VVSLSLRGRVMFSIVPDMCCEDAESRSQGGHGESGGERATMVESPKSELIRVVRPSVESVRHSACSS
jgi:hypothetical protein